MDDKKFVPPEVHSVAEIKELIKKQGLEPGNQSQNRKLLEEGLQIMQNRKHYNDLLGWKLSIDGMGGWVQNLVRDKLGGKLRGMKVVWNIKEKENVKVVEWDPYNNQITEAH